MLHDLRLALRHLLHAPGFTLVTLLTLALGIGATSSIFTVVNSVLLRPVDYADSDSLVVIRQNKLPTYPTFAICPADFYDFSARADKFEDMFALTNESFIATDGDEPTRLRAVLATFGYFSTLRVTPQIGRPFTAAEDQPGHDHVVLLSHSYWMNHYAGSASALGQSLTLNGESFEIIGVMPADFRRFTPTDLYAPMGFTADQRTDRGGHYVSAVGRLKPGVSVAAASAQLADIAAQLALASPESNTGWSAYAVDLLEWNTRGARATLYTLLGAVAVLLVIACANVGSLLMVRATARQGEMSVRAALGASPWQVARLLLTESLVLGVLGGLLGTLVATWSLDLLTRFGGDHIPRAAEISLDGRALFFTLGLSLLTGLVFGLAPVWQTRRLALTNALKSGGRNGAGDRRSQRLRQILVVVELTLAVVLLNSAGLLGRSLVRLTQADPGFQASGRWWMDLNLPDGAYHEPAQRIAFNEAVSARLAQIPGVASVGSILVMPFSDDDYNLSVEFPDRTFAAGEGPSTHYTVVTPGFFPAMGIPILRGRNFADTDRADTPRVALISETFAARLFPGVDPIGQRVNVTNQSGQVWREIIGIVPDLKLGALDEPGMSQFYEPFAQRPFGSMGFVVQTQPGAQVGLTKSMRQAVYAVDPTQPVFHLRAVEDMVADSFGQRRFALTLLGVFAGLALVLAGIGTYGVLAFTVAQRTREFGVRMALGAQAIQVLALVLRDGMRLVLFGLVFGTAASLTLGRVLSSQLYATSAHDPLVLGLIAFVLTTIASVACFLPARRATRVDPMIALRAE